MSRLFLVLAVVPAEDMLGKEGVFGTGRPKWTELGLYGFCPVYGSLEYAKAAWPDHPIIELREGPTPAQKDREATAERAATETRLIAHLSEEGYTHRCMDCFGYYQCHEAECTVRVSIAQPIGMGHCPDCKRRNQYRTIERISAYGHEFVLEDEVRP